MSDAALKLLTHPTFAAFCAAWEADGRAPFAMADWLREQDRWGQADAVEWAERQPDRPGKDSAGGVRPVHRTNGRYAWNRSPQDHDLPSRSWLPPDVFDHLHGDQSEYGEHDEYGTFPEAVADFLDGWALARTPAETAVTP